MTETEVLSHILTDDVSDGQWWSVMVSGGQWWSVVVSGGQWWSVMVSDVSDGQL